MNKFFFKKKKSIEMFRLETKAHLSTVQETGISNNFFSPLYKSCTNILTRYFQRIYNDNFKMFLDSLGHYSGTWRWKKYIGKPEPLLNSEHKKDTLTITVHSTPSDPFSVTLKRLDTVPKADMRHNPFQSLSVLIPSFS